jgi:serine/threonine protein kinase
MAPPTLKTSVKSSDVNRTPWSVLKMSGSPQPPNASINAVTQKPASRLVDNQSRVRTVLFQPGTRIGPYEVLSSLGTGGMSEIFRARDTRLQREVAIKVVGPALAGDAEFLQRLEHEARLVGSLNHANIVAVYDVGMHEGAPYLVTELLQGETLRDRLAKGPVPLALTLRWAIEMADALAAAHDRGIVHRDLKP